MQGEVMATERRIGSEDSETRERLLDAATELMRTEGYSAVTVRRLVAHAGLKRQLVHYYFRSMEELFVAVFRRSSGRYLDHQARVLDCPNPVRAIWELLSNPLGIRLEVEFMSLANHFASVQALMARDMAKSREMQVRAVQRVWPAGHAKPSIGSPKALVVMLRAVARASVMEANVGMTAGHAEALAEIERYIAEFDIGDGNSANIGARR
jgi:AcrR family transcriptional regulator